MEPVRRDLRPIGDLVADKVRASLATAVPCRTIIAAVKAPLSAEWDITPVDTQLNRLCLEVVALTRSRCKLRPASAAMSLQTKAFSS
jgi:hypothetical protein